MRQANRHVAEIIQIMCAAAVPGASTWDLDQIARRELKSRGVDDVLLFCGGIIPQEDIEKIKAMGFSGVFGPGTDTGDIIEFVKAHAPVRT